jgi:AcrR family transcriptional regulator
LPPATGQRRDPAANPSRQRILDAAAVLFARRGLDGVGMREIAQAADLTPASLYNHFPGKQALYEKVLECGVRPLLDLLRGFAARDQTPEAAGEIVDAIMDHLARTPHLPRLIQHEACGGGEHLSRLARDWIRPLVSQGIAEMKRDAQSPWEEAEYPLVIAAWLHLIFGHFAMAPLLEEVFDEDQLSPEALERQTRFLRKLAVQMMRSAPYVEPEPTPPKE